MTKPTSKTASNRETGKHQVDAQRIVILDAAEKLFLENGLENTSMVNIASQVGITRVTLYRYFANRDEIAVAIQVRMMQKIGSVLPQDDPEDSSLEGQRRWARTIIRNFYQLREPFRYIGMFDKIYLDNAAGSSLAQWTKDQLMAGGTVRPQPAGDMETHSPFARELPVILSTIIWFLEKLALRGELTWSDPRIPLEEHLQFFEEMIMRSFDQLENKKE